jgi:ABC-type spermidine/putrescine transport system permease subunit I
MFRRVVLPLAMPGLIAGTLIVFNLNMGAFTSAVLLGGGRVLTLPVVIQRKILLDVDYPIAATLSTLLVGVVFLINLASVLLVRRRAPGT